jgi:hypothetical protein
MRTALKGVPQTGWAMPDGIDSIKIDPTTGTRVDETVFDVMLGHLLGGGQSAITEYFYQEFPPPDAPAPEWGFDPAHAVEPTAPAAPTALTEPVESVGPVAAPAAPAAESARPAAAAEPADKAEPSGFFRWFKQ